MAHSSSLLGPVDEAEQEVFGVPSVSVLASHAATLAGSPAEPRRSSRGPAFFIQ